MKRTMTLCVAIIVVILLAVICAVGSRTLFTRRNEYLGEAAYHRGRVLEETNNLRILAQCHTPDQIVSPRALAKFEKACRLRITYHGELVKQYEIAANHPWREVGPIGKDPGERLLWDAWCDIPDDIVVD